jgi:hypothetical protein
MNMMQPLLQLCNSASAKEKKGKKRKKNKIS